MSQQAPPKEQNVWVVVATFGARYVGRVVDVDGEPVDLTDHSDHVTARRLTLCPAYELFTPMQPVRGPDGSMGVTRSALLLPLDLTTQPARLHVQHIASLLFFTDLDPNDRRQYEHLVQQADQSALQQRAGRAGLTMPSGPLSPASADAARRS